MVQASSLNKGKGITLVELVVVIAIVAILATIAAPNLTPLIHNNRVASQSNELVALISLKKSEAIRRNSSHVVEFISRPSVNEWAAYLNRNITAAAEDMDPTCTVQAIRCVESERVVLTVDNGGAPLEFDQRGYLADITSTRVLTLQHVPCRGDRQRRQITISGTGQISARSGPCV